MGNGYKLKHKKIFDIVINEEYVNNKKFFTARCLNIDIATQGRTYEEALHNIKEAIELYLEDNKTKIPLIKEKTMPPTAIRIFL